MNVIKACTAGMHLGEDVEVEVIQPNPDPNVKRKIARLHSGILTDVVEAGAEVRLLIAPTAFAPPVEVRIPRSHDVILLGGGS